MRSSAYTATEIADTYRHQGRVPPNFEMIHQRWKTAAAMARTATVPNAASKDFLPWQVLESSLLSASERSIPPTAIIAYGALTSLRAPAMSEMKDGPVMI